MQKNVLNYCSCRNMRMIRFLTFCSYISGLFTAGFLDFESRKAGLLNADFQLCFQLDKNLVNKINLFTFVTNLNSKLWTMKK